MAYMFKENWHAGALSQLLARQSYFMFSWLLQSSGKGISTSSEISLFSDSFAPSRGTVLRTIRGQEEEPFGAETWKLTQGRVFRVRRHPWFLF